MILHGGHDFNEAPVRSCTGAIKSMRPQCDPAQWPEFQWGPIAMPNRGHDLKEAPVHSCKGAMSSMRPQRADARGKRPKCAVA